MTFPTLLIQIHQYRTIDPYKQTINLGEKNNEKLQIQKVIQEFLQVDPDTILEKNGSFLVELTIDDIPLILAYDITTDTIGPLTFSDQPSIIFTNFSLSLNTENTRNISSFSQDVLQYLAEIDEDKVKEYSNITKR